MANTGEENEFHVLIIGAGISGLALAQGLQKSSISFEVFESETSVDHYRPREWGMSVHWSLPMLQEVLPVDLFDRFEPSASVNPSYEIPAVGNYMCMYNAENGEAIKNVPMGPMVRVSRRKMRSFCSEGIRVQYDKEVHELRTAVSGAPITVLFKDGSSATGDLVIGADGAKSVVRSCVFDRDDGQAHKIPYTGINMHFCYGNAELSRSILQYLGPNQCAIAIHPKGYWLWLSVQDVPDPEKPEGWSFHLQWTWKVGPTTDFLSELDLTQIKAEARASFAEPFRSIWTNIPGGTKIPRNNISIWPPLAVPDGGFKGHVALVGDAGHAMSFHRGQGVNHGLADAAKLTKILTAVREGGITNLESGLDTYESEMIKRAGEEVAISKMNTEMVHDWERLMQSPFIQRGADRNN